MSDAGESSGTHPQLHAPWRMQYLKQLEADPSTADPLAKDYGGCFLCAAANVHRAVEEFGEEESAAMRKRLVVWVAQHTVCVINRYPYTAGHLMIAPRAHIAELQDLDEATAAEMHTGTVRAIELLTKVMNPQGFNVGINLGAAAGAGVPGHLHRHVVPRWNGDTNFVNVVGSVRVAPQMPETLWDVLREAMET